MSDNEFRVKLNVEAHIDEIAETARSSKNTGSADTKSHAFAKDGFTYRTAYFEDFNGDYYRVRLSIGNNGTVATVYNVGKMTKDVPASAKILAVVGSKPLAVTSSDNSISQDSRNVNRQFSEISDAKMIEDGGTVENDSGEFVAESDGNGGTRWSLSTYESSGRETLRQYLDGQVSESGLTEADARAVLDSMDDIYEICRKYEGEYVPFGAWSRAEVVIDEKGNPVFSVVKPNGEYAMNLDFSLVCKKRRALDAVLNRLIETGAINDFGFGQEEIVRANEIIREHGFEIACDMCFVDAKRYRQAGVADQFVDLYNSIVKSMAKDGQEIDYFNFANDSSLSHTDGGIDRLSDAELDFSEINEIIKPGAKKTVEYRIAQYLKTHPSDRKLLSRGDFMSTAGFDAVKVSKPDILKLYNSKKGTGGPKAAQSDVQYLNDILSSKKFNRGAAYDVGGVRVQSFSDYVPRLVFDYVQMIGDLAAKRLPAHAYTKEPLFAKQFGLTGMKINMSLMPAKGNGKYAGLNADGSYAWAKESFPAEEAFRIQADPEYGKNVGTIAVGISDEHIWKMLSDPDIRMVIPYHKSGINPAVAVKLNIGEYTNYTDQQNTRRRDGRQLTKSELKDIPDINRLMHRDGLDAVEASRRYVEWCEDNGYIPKFEKFAYMTDSDGSRVFNENYYKLLEDFTTMVDAEFHPQGDVTATFPGSDSAFGSMADLIKEGLEEDAVTANRLNGEVDGLAEEVRSALGREESGKRFSLSSNVEQTKDLIAVHNMTAAELEKSLDLGGLPMPSIAIIKAADGHSEYGDVSLVFGKDTIDPKKSARNKVYGGDAWTPTFPKIDYKANEKVGKRIRDKYYDLSRKYGYDNTRALYDYAQDLSDVLTSKGGEKAMIDKLYGDTGMMQIYLMDTGRERVANVNKETKTALTDGQVRQYENLIDTLGRDEMNGFARKDGEELSDLVRRRKAFIAENEAGIRKAFEKTFIEDGMSAKDAAEVSAELALSDLRKYVLDTFNYIKNGAETVKTEFDSEATDAAIKKAADGEGYRKWVNDLFGGAEEKSGIRNSKDAYTASGNRRSFEALHWENNLENIVKAMLEQDETGGAFFSGTGIWGVSAKKYNSISEIKNDSSRLRTMNEAEYNALKEQYGARMQEIAQTLIDPKNDNYFIASDDAYSLIVDAVRNSKDESGILRYLKKYNSRATEKTASDIAALVRDIAEMPTGYFEAKPQRAVGFDEVKAVILPDNASGELVSRLESDGINTVTYKAGDENSRLEALNGVRDVRFSLTRANGITTEITDDSYDEYEGGYQRRDIKLNGETVGTVAIRIYDDHSEIDRIDIDEKYRNKGIGTTVLGDIAGEFDTTYIVPDNESAKRLYERIGEEVTSGEVYENLDQGYGVYRLDKSYGNTRWSLAGKYDYSKSFADQIDDYKNGLLPVYDTFVVSETPKVWQDIGFNALPVTLNQTHVDYALNGTKDADHEISEADLKKLPEKIKEPIAIMQSQSNPSRAVVLIEMTSKSGNSIVVPVEVDGYGTTNSITIDSNALASMFGKKNAPKQLKNAIDNTVNGKTELFYWDKKRSLALLHLAGLQLPGNLPQDGFVHSIREPGSLVKAKMDDVTNSLQFKRWFGDWKGGKRNVSKVVNRDGSPRVVYHYTDADFEAFDTSKSGSNQGVTHGDGIYVSTNPKEFAYAGKNRLDLYASIKKPFEMQLTKSQAERVYDKYFAPYHVDKYNTYRPHVIEKLQSRSRVFDYLSEAADNGKVRTSDILKELGYDGVHDGSEWVAFDSTQLKSATDNIGTFDKDNPKFRYSLAKSTQSELKALQKENEKLRQDVDDLKQELQLTHGRKLSRDALISSIQKILIDGYGVKLSAKELYPEVTNLYDMFYNNTVDGKRLKKGEHVDTMRIIEEMDKIVDAVIENAVGVDDTYVEMKKLLPELRNTKLVVPMDARADAAQSAGFENWAEFRKANFGRVGFANEGLPVDTYYMELSERYPELFPDGITHPGEQAAHIADVVNTIRESGINEYQLYDIEDERIRTSIKNDVMDIIGNAEKLQTFADRAAQKVEDTKLAEAMHYGADIAKLKRLNAEKVADIKAENRKRLSDMRRKYQDRVESVRERYAEARANRSEKQKQTVLRNKVLRKYTEASSMLDRPTTENHFTEAMRKPLMEFLAAVDITTGKSVAKQGVYDRILKVISDAQREAAGIESNSGLKIEETDLNVQERELIDHSGILDRMRNWVEANKGKKLTELSSAQLTELNGIFNQLTHVMAEIKRLYDPREGLAAKSWQAQKEIGLAKKRDRNTRLWVGLDVTRKFVEWMHYGVSDAYGFFNIIGSDVMDEQLRTFRKCYDKFGANIDLLSSLMADAVGKDGIPKEWHGKKAKEITLNLSTGTLRATPSQLMTIHLLLNQEDSRRCLFDENGGLVIGKFKARAAVQTEKNRTKNWSLFRTASVFNEQSGKFVLNEADAAKITAALTDAQIECADKISAILNGEAARLGNEVSMAMYGYKKYTIKNYFPMMTTTDYNAIASNPNHEMNLLGLPFTNERTGRSGKPLVAEDIFDVVGRHLTNMAQYNAFAQELDNAKKMYTLRLGNGTSLKQTLIRQYGDQADKRYRNLINNMSGAEIHASQGAEAISEKLLANYKAAAVSKNLSVVLKQPMSIFRALPEFSPAGLKAWNSFKDFSPSQVKAEMNEMLEHSGIAKLKNWGASENMTRKSFEELYNNEPKNFAVKANDAVNSMAEYADMWTWSRLWRMSKAEIEAQNKYTKGSKEYFEAVNSKFSEVIGKTQVVQSALDSSMAVQNAGTASKFLYAFQNEPLKQYSYLTSAIIDAARGKPGAKAKLAKVIASSLANTVAVSAISTAMSLLRGTLDRDDDDELWDDILKSFGKNVIMDLASGGLAPVWQIVESAITAIESGKYGNTVERMDLAALTDLGGLINKYLISQNGGRPNLGMLQDIVNAASNLFGWSAKNVMRDLKAGLDRIIFDSGLISPMTQYNYLKWWKDVELTNKAAVTEAYYDVLRDAVDRGRYSDYVKIKRDMIYHGYTETKIKNAVMKSSLMDDLYELKKVNPGSYKAKVNSIVSSVSAVSSLEGKEFEDFIESAMKRREREDGGSKTDDEVYDEMHRKMEKEVKEQLIYIDVSKRAAYIKKMLKTYGEYGITEADILKVLRKAGKA
jgi:ribosomal protein S18 acetylase RimI-like enzyme